MAERDTDYPLFSSSGLNMVLDAMMAVSAEYDLGLQRRANHQGSFGLDGNVEVTVENDTYFIAHMTGIGDNGVLNPNEFGHKIQMQIFKMQRKKDK